MPLKIITGKTQIYFETGMEGAHWIVEPPQPTSLADLGWIEPGDHLTLRSPVGALIFDGVIEPGRGRDETVSSAHPNRIQASALGGLWVYWTQASFEPDAWAALFVHGENQAVLTKAQALIEGDIS